MSNPADAQFPNTTVCICTFQLCIVYIIYDFLSHGHNLPIKCPQRDRSLCLYTKLVDGIKKEIHHFGITSQSFCPVNAHSSQFRFLSLPLWRPRCEWNIDRCSLAPHTVSTTFSLWIQIKVEMNWREFKWIRLWLFTSIQEKVFIVLVLETPWWKCDNDLLCILKSFNSSTQYGWRLKNLSTQDKEPSLSCPIRGWF